MLEVPFHLAGQAQAAGLLDINLGIRGRAMGRLARVLYPDLPP